MGYWLVVETSVETSANFDSLKKIIVEIVGDYKSVVDTEEDGKLMKEDSWQSANPRADPFPPPLPPHSV